VFGNAGNGGMKVLPRFRSIRLEGSDFLDVDVVRFGPLHDFGCFGQIHEFSFFGIVGLSFLATILIRLVMVKSTILFDFVKYHGGKWWAWRRHKNRPLR
jgi:hypothetical protein